VMVPKSAIMWINRVVAGSEQRMASVPEGKSELADGGQGLMMTLPPRLRESSAMSGMLEIPHCAG
jgi:glutathione synthase/RimK-type ligase-like ATP-grasp enzyme